VIRDSLRPEIPEDADQTDFADLITTCWHQDPSIRCATSHLIVFPRVPPG
jgi:hypothetical protein